MNHRHSLRTGLAAMLVLGTAASSQAATISSGGLVVANDPIWSQVHDFGTGAPNTATGGLPANISFTAADVGVDISFSPYSGLYSGDSGTSRSPFRSTDGTGGAPDHATEGRNYLTARAADDPSVSETTKVQIDLRDFKLTALKLLWGSVDLAPSTYNRIQFFDTTSATPTLVDEFTAADLPAFFGDGTIVSGTTDVWVRLTTQAAFNRVVFTATTEAFEFSLFDPVEIDRFNVPEPTLLALSGIAMLTLVRRRRSR